MALQSNTLIEIEIEFSRFYHFLIASDLQTRNKEFNTSLLKRVRNAYCRYSLQNGVSDIDFGYSGIRSAYIFSNIPIFTGSVFYHFSNMMHSDRLLFRKGIAQKSLTISCFGGGPAAEVLAITKALEFSLKNFYVDTKPLIIHANIVDIDPGWKDTVKLIRHKWWKFFDRRYIRLNLSFVQFDLTQPFSEEIQDIIKRSDLITMVHFISALYGSKGREKISRMLQEIIDHLDKNGVIFFVNCARFSCVEQLNDVLGTSRDMEVIYNPAPYHTYQLSEPCYNICYELYARHFDVEPIVQCKNHVVAWRKVEMQAES